MNDDKCLGLGLGGRCPDCPQWYFSREADVRMGEANASNATARTWPCWQSRMTRWHAEPSIPRCHWPPRWRPVPPETEPSPCCRRYTPAVYRHTGVINKQAAKVLAAPGRIAAHTHTFGLQSLYFAIGWYSGTCPSSKVTLIWTLIWQMVPWAHEIQQRLASRKLSNSNTPRLFTIGSTTVRPA